MKASEYAQLDNADVVPFGRRDDLTVDIVAHWDAALWVRVQQRGTTVFACSVTPQPPSWLITECLPRRRGPEAASMLLHVCEHLAAELRASEIIAIHPAFWDEQLAAGGASLRQRVVPMWTPLDDDLLLMHSRPLPNGYQVTPLDASVDEPVTLAQLSTDADHERYLRAWQDALSIVNGPVIQDASLKVTKGSMLCAAVAVTEYHGRPLLAHFVTATRERGKGLGRTLLVECLKGLSESGYADCRLNVSEDNWIARRLYRSVGFIQDRPTLRVSHVSRKQAGDAT